MQIVSLTTDYGYTDYYAAALKASLLSQCKSINIVDISHNIDTYDIIQGAFFLANTYLEFPEGSIHLVAINNFSDERLKLITFERNKHFFVGPDNGIFSLIFSDLRNDEVFELDASQADYNIQHMFGSAVKAIAEQTPLDQLGKSASDFTRKLILRPVVTKTSIRATIIHTDHYGNVITNLDKPTFEKAIKGRSYAIYYKNKDPIQQISKHYGEAEIGDVLCLFNNANYLEIAINSGNAAELLGLKKNETIQIDFLD